MPQQTFSITQGNRDAWAGMVEPTYSDTAAPTLNSTENQVGILRAFFSPDYYKTVGLVKFDTANLNDAATLTAAKLRLQVYEVQRNATDDLSISLEWINWPEDSTAYTHTPSSSAMAPVPLSALSIGVVDFTLANLNNISLTGLTGIRIHMTQRPADAAPVGFNSFRFHSFENTSAQPVPQLIVDYALPTTRIVPDAIISSTNLTGTVSAIQDDPDSDTGVWLTAP